MSDSTEALVKQASDCVALVEGGQLSEALVVLQGLSNNLKQSALPHPDQSTVRESQRIVDLLAQALLGATKQREETRIKLHNLSREKQMKAVYAASPLPQ